MNYQQIKEAITKKIEDRQGAIDSIATQIMKMEGELNSLHLSEQQCKGEKSALESALSSIIEAEAIATGVVPAEPTPKAPAERSLREILESIEQHLTTTPVWSSQAAPYNLPDGFPSWVQPYHLDSPGDFRFPSPDAPYCTPSSITITTTPTGEATMSPASNVGIAPQPGNVQHSIFIPAFSLLKDNKYPDLTDGCP